MEGDGPSWDAAADRPGRGWLNTTVSATRTFSAAEMATANALAGR